MSQKNCQFFQNSSVSVANFEHVIAKPLQRDSLHLTNKPQDLLVIIRSTSQDKGCFDFEASQWLWILDSWLGDLWVNISSSKTYTEKNLLNNQVPTRLFRHQKQKKMFTKEKRVKYVSATSAFWYFSKMMLLLSSRNYWHLWSEHNTELTKVLSEK